MSFNRNQRRDRNSGGGGGGGGGRYSGGSNNRGSRDFGRDYGGNYGRSSSGGGNSSVGVNPWAGCSTPESRPSLLPTPGTNNILSQLTNSITSPEAQLLMASNLLSKLFTPANQVQNNMPSLLNITGLGSNYSNSNYSPRDMDRGRNYNSHRSEPYNKSSLGRRNQSNQSNNKARNSGPQNRRRPSSSPAKSPKKTDHESKDSADRKRKVEDVKKEPEERKIPKIKEEKKENEPPKADSQFTGIPKALLYCYVCHKHMWDDVSFENHVKGRPHEWMLSKLDETNKLVVDLLRHQVRTNEEQRRMKFQRLKKNRGSGNMKCEFCAMCDVDIRGSLAAHRRNYLHLKLKRFLHPKCLSCKKEFHNRLDFNLHKISADHLKILAGKRRLRRPDLKDDDYDLEDFVVLDDAGGSFTWGGDEACLSGEIKVSTKVDAEEDIEETKVKKEDPDVETKEEGKEDEEGENAKGKDDTGKIPIYNPAAVVGPELLVEVTGKFCRACYRFMKTEEDSLTHCRTVTHYENYRMFAKVQNVTLSDRKLTTNVKVEKDGGLKKEGEEVEEEDDGEEYDLAEDANEDGDVPTENGTEETKEEKEVKEEEKVESKKDTKEENEDEKEEKYDPQEPTEDAKEPEIKTALGKQPQKSQQRARRGAGRRSRPY